MKLEKASENVGRDSWLVKKVLDMRRVTVVVTKSERDALVVVVVLVVFTVLVLLRRLLW